MCCQVETSPVANTVTMCILTDEEHSLKVIGGRTFTNFAFDTTFFPCYQITLAFGYNLLSCLQIYCCVGELSVASAMHHIDADWLGWWLCERQLSSGGLNGKRCMCVCNHGITIA